MSFTVSSLLIPIQLCGGKKTKYSKYNNVFRVFLSFSLTFDAISCYCDYKIRNFLRYHLFMRFVQILYKKMKKVLRHSVWRGRCRVLESVSHRGFWGFLAIWSRAWLKKIFWFFLGKFTTQFRICATDLKRGCWIYRKKPQHFNVYILLLQQKNRSLRLATVIVLFNCVLTLVVNNGC